MPISPNYPALNEISRTGGGNTNRIRQDALGRLVYRNDPEKIKLPMQRPTAGGMPDYRGPEAFSSDLLESAQALGRPMPQQRLQKLLQRLQSYGSSPQERAKTLRTSDPKQQAAQMVMSGV